MKRKKWKNIMVALIFISSLTLILTDSVKIVLGYGYTFFGAITGLIALIISFYTYEYLEAEMEN